MGYGDLKSPALEGAGLGDGDRPARRRSAGRAAWLVHQLVKNGQKESCGFPAARGGAGKEIPAFEGRRNRFRLNRGRALEAQFVDASNKGRVQLECRKSQGFSDVKALSRRAGLSRSISWRRF